MILFHNTHWLPDINECANDTFNDCDKDNGECYNSIGSYSCNCVDGYKGDGKTCEDINECEEELAECDENASCENKPASYECTCNVRFEGNGLTCTGGS